MKWENTVGGLNPFDDWSLYFNKLEHFIDTDSGMYLSGKRMYGKSVRYHRRFDSRSCKDKARQDKVL
jgi:hypothetical protein